MKTTKTVLVIIAIFFSLAVKAQQPEGVSIKKNSSPPNASAMLEVDANDKGILIPRVVLTASNVSTSPITTPTCPTSLLVYNTNASYLGSANGGSGTGFYYWFNITPTTGKWIKLFDGGTGAAGPMASFIPKISFAQMKALTASMTDNDLGTMVFVMDIDVKVLSNGINVAATNFYNTPPGTGHTLQNVNVFGLWYLSKVPVCDFQTSLTPNAGICWRYISNTNNGRLISNQNVAELSTNTCINPN